MPLLLNDVVLITYHSDIFNQRILLTLTYKVSAASTGGNSAIQDLQAIANEFASTVTSEVLIKYLGILPENCVVKKVRAQKIYPLPRTAFVEAEINSDGQSDDGVATASNVAGVITLKTDLGGRSQVANKHIGPLAAGAYTAGKLGGATLTDFGDLAVALKTAVIPADGPVIVPVIYHRNADGPTTKTDLVTGALVQDTLRTMRRRTVGLGI